MVVLRVFYSIFVNVCIGIRKKCDYEIFFDFNGITVCGKCDLCTECYK